MAGRERGDVPRKRFSKTGHTTHRTPPPPPATAPVVPPSPYPPPAYPPNVYPPQPYPPQPYPPQPYPPAQPGGYGPPPVSEFGAATYHHVPGAAELGAAPTGADAFAAVGAADAAAAKHNAAVSAAIGTQRFARFVTRKVITASEAKGARESGLTPLIWNQVLSYGTDAMITVALASTVFFGASTHAQRGNVLLYLLVTMAPFAVVAPVIGPALDRIQHGRRWAMAGTAIGRAVLAVVMASHSTDLLVLYPCALGSLVFSKAYGVVRAAAAPRLVPPGMTLVEANARLSIFGLVAAVIGGGFVGAVIKLTGSYSAGLLVTAVAFGACGYFAFRLPPQVDSATPAPRHPEEPSRPRTQQRVPPMDRLRVWARRGFLPQVITSLQAESALRFMTGFLTIFMAFYVESTRHGAAAALALGAVLGAAGVGNFIGTAIGARITLNRPEIAIMIGAGVASVVCLVAALLYNIDAAVIGMLVSGAANALGKLALDAVIQRDVAETLRSSAFGRSETFLQLAWVLGAALACLVPSDNGSLGFWIAGGSVGLVTIVVVLRNRAMNQIAARHPEPPGTVGQGQTPSY